MITRNSEIDHFGMLYRKVWRPDIQFKDVIYDKYEDCLYIATYDSNNRSSIMRLNKESLEQEGTPIIISGIHVLKLYTSENNGLFYIGRPLNESNIDSEGIVRVGTINKTLTSYNNKITTDNTRMIFYSDTPNDIILGYNDKIVRIGKSSMNSIQIATVPGELLGISAIGQYVYYSYKIRDYEIDPNDPGKYMNLHKCYVYRIPIVNGTEEKVTRLVSYNDVDDVTPTNISSDGTNLIIGTSDGYIRLYRDMEYYKRHNPKMYNIISSEGYDSQFVLYDKFIPGFNHADYNSVSTCTTRDENLLYIGNSIGDIYVYIDKIYDSDILILSEFALDKQRFRINKLVDYDDGSYMDNVGNAAITDIITYDHYLTVNFDGNGLALYTRDLYPYIDGEIAYNNSIREGNLRIDLSFVVNHTDKRRRISYNVILESKSNPDAFRKKYKYTNMRCGYKHDETYIIKFVDIMPYDLQLSIELTDDLGNSIDPIIYDVDTLYVEDPLVFQNQISICYHTAPMNDLKIKYTIIGYKPGYIKTSRLDPDSILYDPVNYDEKTQKVIEASGITKGDYFCIIDDWQFNNPLRSVELTAISTNGLDWKISVDSEGRLITEPFQGTSFNYINIPIDSDLPEKFIYKYEFYTNYGFRKVYPNEEEYYIYDTENTIEKNFRSRETGDLNNHFDFHLLDVIINFTKKVNIGRTLYLKARDIIEYKLVDDNNWLMESNEELVDTKQDQHIDLEGNVAQKRIPIYGDWKVFKVTINEKGDVVTELVVDPKKLGLNIDEINEYERLSFRENRYSSSVTLNAKTADGIKYWDFSIITQQDEEYNRYAGSIKTTPTNMDNRYSDLVFITREKFDYKYVSNILRRLSNPVSFLISNQDHSKYEVTDSIDKAGTKTAVAVTRQMEMMVNPLSEYTDDNLLQESERKYLNEAEDQFIELDDSYMYDENGIELFTAHYHYFDVYIDGKKLRKEQIMPVRTEHGDYSVRFPYAYSFTPTYYILRCIKFDENAEKPADRFKELENPPLYKLTMQQDDRVKLEEIGRSEVPDNVEIRSYLGLQTGWIFLTLDKDDNMICNSTYISNKYDKKNNRSYPKYYEVNSEYENSVKFITLIEDPNLLYDNLLMENRNRYVQENLEKYIELRGRGTNTMILDGYRMHTYDGYKNKSRFFSVEAVLNSTPNYSTEETVCTRVVTTDDEVQQLYAGTFAMKLNCSGKNLSNSDFFVFVRFLHASYYTRIDRGYFEVTRRSGDSDTIYVKLDNAILASVNAEIVLTTVDVERTITFTTDEDSKTPYYYIPLIQYDKTGNSYTYYSNDVSNFDVFIDGFALMPSKDYSLVNCCLHSHMPSMLVFESGIKPGSKVEINYYDEDVTDTLIVHNEDNKDIVEIKDNDNLFVSNTFIVYVNGRKLDATQYIIQNRKTLQILVPEREYIVVKFQYKKYNNMKQVLDLLHTSDDFMNESEKYTNGKMTVFSSDTYEGINDEVGYGKAYQILGYGDQCFNEEKDAVYDCNTDINDMIDTPINTGVNYQLDYFNNDLIIDCNEGYSKYDHTLYLPNCQIPNTSGDIRYKAPEVVHDYKIVTTKSGQRILEFGITDPDSDDYSIVTMWKGDTGVQLRRDRTYTTDITDGCYRICGTRFYHDITNESGMVSYTISDYEGNEVITDQIDIG